MVDTDKNLHFIELALDEAQATVRAYDTKAQIVGIGYTFALNIVAGVTGGFPGIAEAGLWPVVFFWGIVMAPLFLFGAVLYPSRKIAPRVARPETVRRLLYVETQRYGDVESFEAALEGADWRHELTFELLKVTRLREMKRGRFIRALFVTALSFALQCTYHAWRML